MSNALKTRKELMKRVHELKGELSLVERELGQRFRFYWTDHLGWVVLPDGDDDVVVRDEGGRS